MKKIELDESLFFFDEISYTKQLINSPQPPHILFKDKPTLNKYGIPPQNSINDQSSNRSLDDWYAQYDCDSIGNYFPDDDRKIYFKNPSINGKIEQQYLFSSDRKPAFQTITPTPLPKDLPIVEQEQCAKYAATLKRSPDAVPAPELSSIINQLLTAPVLLAYGELKDIALDKTRQLEENGRTRVANLVSRFQDTTVDQLAQTGVASSHYRMKIVKPGRPVAELQSDLQKIDMCWNFGQNSQYELLQRDADIGACIQFVGECLGESHRLVPRTYTRNYVARTKSGETIIFLTR